jgi:hypothetical protein
MTLQTFSGASRAAYTTFCLDIVGKLTARAGTVFNERTLREELAFFAGLRDGGSAA